MHKEHQLKLTFNNASHTVEYAVGNDEFKLLTSLNQNQTERRNLIYFAQKECCLVTDLLISFFSDVTQIDFPESDNVLKYLLVKGVIKEFRFRAGIESDPIMIQFIDKTDNATDQYLLLSACYPNDLIIETLKQQAPRITYNAKSETKFIEFGSNQILSNFSEPLTVDEILETKILINEDFEIDFFTENMKKDFQLDVICSNRSEFHLNMIWKKDGELKLQVIPEGETNHISEMSRIVLPNLTTEEYLFYINQVEAYPINKPPVKEDIIRLARK